jgi:MSHA pilin protein MshA
MRKSMNNEKGFTLIELVMVIVILGILAATAIPKFVDLKSDAQLSVAEGITGALAGQITMLHAQYLINSTAYAVADVAASIDTTGLSGIAGSSGEITATLDDGTIYTWTYTERSGASTAATLAGPNS